MFSFIKQVRCINYISLYIIFRFSQTAIVCLIKIVLIHLAHRYVCFISFFPKKKYYWPVLMLQYFLPVTNLTAKSNFGSCFPSIFWSTSLFYKIFPNQLNLWMFQYCFTLKTNILLNLPIFIEHLLIQVFLLVIKDKEMRDKTPALI